MKNIKYITRSQIYTKIKTRLIYIALLVGKKDIKKLLKKKQIQVKPT